VAPAGRLELARERDALDTLDQRATFTHNADGRATHATIPFDDYVYLMALRAARDAIPKLEDPNYEWVDWEDALTEFAAPQIAAARKKKGWTQAQLGAKLKMPQSQISRMEKHPESVTYRTLTRIAKALGIPVTGLLEGLGKTKK
jgi:DNA-binding Xre family transcriptional regulator